MGHAKNDRVGFDMMASFLSGKSDEMSKSQREIKEGPTRKSQIANEKRHHYTINYSS
jgi:hypothetical protein